MLTKKQLNCIKLMVEGELSQKEIASSIKVSEQTICKWKKDSEFKIEFENHVKNSIDYSSREAFKTMLKSLNARSEMVRYMAAKDILDRAGFKPTEKVNVEGAVPVVIVDDLEDDEDDEDEDEEFDD